MSDYAPDSGVAEWIALRRAHQGGVANLAGQWLDSGRPVPGYVADALDGLTSAGLLTLADADPESCGARRITVTDRGCARYVALCQIHNPRATVAVGTPRRWARSPHDQRSHLLAQRAIEQIGVLVAVCGHRMRWSTRTSAQPTGRQCPTCQALAPVQVPADIVAAGSHAQALCRRALPAEDFTVIRGSTGALCLAWLAEIPPPAQTQPEAHHP